MNHVKIFCWYPDSPMGPPDIFLKGISAPDFPSMFGKLSEVRRPHQLWACVLCVGERFETISTGQSDEELVYLTQRKHQGIWIACKGRPEWSVEVPMVHGSLSETERPGRPHQGVPTLRTKFPTSRLLSTEAINSSLPQEGWTAIHGDTMFFNVRLFAQPTADEISLECFGMVRVNGKDVLS